MQSISMRTGDFQELETETKKLHDESKKYFDAINGMMTHQIEFSQAIAEIYKPISVEWRIQAQPSKKATPKA